MYERGELPVHVRVVVEGEEEAGSVPVMDWLERDERGADCCIVFDSGSLDPSNPAITVGTRGVIGASVTVTVADADMHSGVFGGSVHNAIHVLARMLPAVLPGSQGLLRDELRAGIEAIPEAERASWAHLPPGDLVLQFSGGRPLHAESGHDYFAQNGGEPSVDVNMISSGDPRTIVPARAKAYLTMRLAPGQDHIAMQAAVERLLREAAPDVVDVDIRWDKGVDAAVFDGQSPPLRIAQEAFEAACGVAPVLFRLGGSIPILEVLARRGIQTIVSGFATPFDQIHAPNESYPLESLTKGAATARELYTRLAALPSKR
jgi:acetylornithine deacetylase/succinyl-diaminopimelate desuccinylase-like protein